MTLPATPLDQKGSKPSIVTPVLEPRAPVPGSAICHGQVSSASSRTDPATKVITKITPDLVKRAFHLHGIFVAKAAYNLGKVFLDAGGAELARPVTSSSNFLPRRFPDANTRIDDITRQIRQATPMAEQALLLPITARPGH